MLSSVAQRNIKLSNFIWKDTSEKKWATELYIFTFSLDTYHI